MKGGRRKKPPLCKCGHRLDMHQTFVWPEHVRRSMDEEAERVHEELRLKALDSEEHNRRIGEIAARHQHEMVATVGHCKMCSYFPKLAGWIDSHRRDLGGCARSGFFGGRELPSCKCYWAALALSVLSVERERIMRWMALTELHSEESAKVIWALERPDVPPPIASRHVGRPRPPQRLAYENAVRLLDNGGFDEADIARLLDESPRQVRYIIRQKMPS